MGTSGNVGWRLVGDNLTSHDDDLLLPSSYFIVRNQNGAPDIEPAQPGSCANPKQDDSTANLKLCSAG
jgi:hypothetical protein